MKAELLQSIIDAAKDAIFMIDVEGNVSYLNRAAEAMLGYAKEELMGENLHWVLAPKVIILRSLRASGGFERRGMGPRCARMVDLSKPFNTSKSSGTGLGLSFCKMAVGAHGRRIEAESRVGVGDDVYGGPAGEALVGFTLFS